MIKFILGVIAMILVALVAYMYMDSKNEHVPLAKVPHKTEASIIKKEALSIQKKTVPVKTKVLSEKKVEKIPIINSERNHENLIENDYSDSLTSTEEEVRIFEEKIAQEFSEESEYTGKIYGRDDFLGNEVSSADSMSQDDEKNKYTEEWQQKEMDTPTEE